MNIFNKKPFLIADIGVNFFEIAQNRNMSCIDASKLMIHEAKKAGADAVNFYFFKSENILSSKFTISNDYYFKFHNAFDKKDFKKLSDFCKEINIEFLVTPLDCDSADSAEKYADVFMFHSADLTNIPFIRHVASKNKSLLISTGASTLNEIKDAIKVCENSSNFNIAIMHNVLSFNSSFDDANLLMIKDLIQNFPEYEIGYCDAIKTDENMLILFTAYAYGASILFKPFTLDKSLKGHEIAMDADDIKKFKQNCNFLSKINGSSMKQPVISESSARREFRKSIVAKTDIKKGEKITLNNIDFKIPGYGISPADVDDVVGKILIKDVGRDELLDYDFFEK